MSADLGGHSVRAVKWAAVSSVTRFAIQLAVQVKLARMLGPDAYGVFGMALVMMTLALFLIETGFAMNLVQRQDLTEEDIRVIVTWQFLQGSLVALLLFFAAPLAAAYFQEPRVIPVVRWMGLVALLMTLGVPSDELLARDLNFLRRGLIDIAGYVVGFAIVGIGLGLAGYGPLALAGAWVAQYFTRWVLSYSSRPYPLRPLLWSSRARSLLTFGIAAFFNNIVNYLSNNLDRIVLGRMMVAHSVGLYTVAFNLANTPNSLLISSLQGVILSAGARLQGDRERLRASWLQIISAVWILIAPVFVVLSVLSWDLVHLLYGSKWEGAGPLLAVLMLAMPWFIALGVSTPALWNMRRMHLEWSLQVPLIGLALVALVLAARHSLEAAAVAAALIYVARAVTIMTAVARILGAGVRDFTDLTLRAVRLCVLAALVAEGGRRLVLCVTDASWAVLAGATLACLIVGGALFWWCPRWALGEPAARVVARFAPRLAAHLGVETWPDAQAPSEGT